MSETNHTLSELPRALVKRVPELEEAMEQEASYWADRGAASLGPDTAFSMVLAPYVLERLKRDENGEDDVLRRIFAFLEELASSEEADVLSAVDVSFGESLLGDSEAYRKAQKYMGPRLREALEFVLARWRGLPKRFL